jgi:hypothetical protein
MRSQRFGVRTTRRIKGNCCAARYRAVTPVGGDHEILDDLFGAIRPFFDEIVDLLAVK